MLGLREFLKQKSIIFLAFIINTSMKVTSVIGPENYVSMKFVSDPVVRALIMMLALNPPSTILEIIMKILDRYKY